MEKFFFFSRAKIFLFFNSCTQIRKFYSRYIVAVAKIKCEGRPVLKPVIITFSLRFVFAVTIDISKIKTRNLIFKIFAFVIFYYKSEFRTNKKIRIERKYYSSEIFFFFNKAKIY